MKKTIVSAFLFAAACTAGLAQAQTAAPASQEFQYPSVRSKDGSLSPPSTLRITVTGEGGAQAPAAISDTPASKSEYERCRRSRTAPRCRTRRCRPAWRNACASWSSAASSSSGAARTAGRGRSGAGPGFRVVMGITFTLIDFRPAQGPEL